MLSFRVLFCVAFKAVIRDKVPLMIFVCDFISLCNEDLNSQEIININFILSDPKKRKFSSFSED